MDPSPFKAAMTKNLGHIRAVEFTVADDTQLQALIQGLPLHSSDTFTDPGALCTNLRRISIQDFDIDRLHLMARPLVTLLDHNPFLTHLNVSSEFFKIDGVPAAASKLLHLRRLAVHSYSPSARIPEPLLLLKACLALPKLTELNFWSLEMCWDDADEATVRRAMAAVIKEATILRFSRSSNAKKIKSLRLPSNRTGLWDPLPLLLLKSDLLDLETCDIPWFRPDADICEIEQVVRKHCPNLKHLSCPSFLNEEQDGQAVRAFIRGCSGLQRFDSSRFSDGSDNEPRKILSELVSRHYATLEVFELSNAYEVLTCDLQDILSRCRLLKRFWVICEYDTANVPGVTFEDICKSDWVCTELRELGVILSRWRFQRDASGELGVEEEQVAAEICKRVYQQIGRLEKLQVLEIDIDRSPRAGAKEHDYRWDLTLSKGWLGEWAGLRSLKSLTLKANFWSNMGQAEVEFIHEHWPLLKEISFSYEIAQIHEMAHWQWLLNKRPQLRLVDWSRQFQSMLWTVLDIDYPMSKLLHTDLSPTMAALTKNLGHIRELTIHWADDDLLLLFVRGLPDKLGEVVKEPGTLCTNLRRIEFKDVEEGGSGSITPSLLTTLLHYNPCLTHLTVPLEFLKSGAALATIPNLRHLQHLTLQSFHPPSYIDDPMVFLRSCLAPPELTELNFVDVEMCWDDDKARVVRKLKAIINEASMARASRLPNAKKIKSLRLPWNRRGLWNPLPLLLLTSELSDLETCEIPWFCPEADIREIETVVQVHCPNLKHLMCPDFHSRCYPGLNWDDKFQNGRPARAFIRGCSKLQSFTSTNFTDGAWSRQPLLILSELVSRHHTTLVDFHLNGAEEVFGRDLQQVLSRCKQLRRFRVIRTQWSRICAIAFREITASDWVCSGLRQLGITLNRCRCAGGACGELGEEEVQDDPQVWLDATVTRRAYQQIGRMEQLEILEIDIDRSCQTRAKEIDYVWDLTLWKGWLGEWAGLRNLKSLRLRADFWSNMRQLDVEFMHEHWPLLGEIVFSCDISQIHSEPHSQWLLEKRPQLRLVSDED
ncbi:hypothetical protein BGZ72_001292 [Mortierella alpina]|nr:hypothetical protein BGZ72_001292 [Mortierella alpina]